MGSTAPAISWRTLCAQHLSHLVETLERQVEAEVQSRVSTAVDGAIETAITSAVNRSRRELSEELNLAVRQLRLCMTVAEIPAALADAASPFAERIAVFAIQDNLARAAKPRGNAKTGKNEVSLDEAPALRAVIESRDPVVALASEGEVSALVLEALGPGEGDKIYLFPVVAGRQVVAILCAAGALHAAALELITGVAALYWETLGGAAKAKSAGLLTISGTMWKQPQAATAAPPEKKSGGKWWELTPHERQLHLSAQRFARLHVAEMRLYRMDAVRSGRARLDLYDALRDSIDTAREGFRQKFIGASKTMVDYLHLELLRSLADDDPHLLGHEYPGPLA